MGDGVEPLWSMSDSSLQIGLRRGLFFKQVVDGFVPADGNVQQFILLLQGIWIPGKTYVVKEDGGETETNDVMAQYHLPRLPSAGVFAGVHRGCRSNDGQAPPG
jgi:hypothetical protein